MVDKDIISDAKSSLWNDIKKQYSIVDRKDVTEKVNSIVGDWGEKAFRRLQVDNPFHEDHAKLQDAKNSLSEGNVSMEMLEDDVNNYQSFIRKTSYPIDDYWGDKLSGFGQTISAMREKYKKAGKKNKINNWLKKISYNNEKEILAKEQKAFRGSLHNNWQKNVDRAISEWEIEQINKLLNEILEKIKSWLDLIQQMFDLLKNLSMEPGLLFDLSKGTITNQDIEELRRWSEYISKDNGVRELCDMLGRLRRAEQSKREEVVKYKTKINIEVPDINSREEVIGVKLGKDIENAIPQELALLADADTSILFDLKFIERRIMIYETQGMQQLEIEIEKKKKIQVKEDEKMGPVIICVDTSGSMQGAPETIAKAVTLYMATRAASQDRSCYLINFSTGIDTMDLSGGIGLEKVISFLRKSFNGGTDVAPALSHAIEVIQKEEYKQSDVLTVSDFVMPDLPENLREAISEAKEDKNKFYSLCISGQFISEKLRHIFDKEWVYNPSNSSIKEVHGFLDGL